MDNTINGRTPEEIKKGLELCIGNSDLSEDYCEKCPYIPDASCRDTLEIDALAYIQQLEHGWDELFETAKQLERERDAAVEDIEALLSEGAAGCDYCKKMDSEEECREMKTAVYCNPIWRGVQEVE